MPDDTTYRIERCHQRDSIPRKTMQEGLTLEEAQDHCNDPESSSKTATGKSAVAYTEQHGPWFDAYYEE